MKYDISKQTAPTMPTLGKGTECIKILLSQVSKDIQEPLVPMLFPVLGAHVSGAEFQYPDLTWKGQVSHERQREMLYLCRIKEQARSSMTESPKQTHRKLGANASKARSKRIESSEQTTRKLGANDPKARSKRPESPGQTLKFLFKLNFVDFCHDSAKQACLMALAAPKVQISNFKLQIFTIMSEINRIEMAVNYRKNKNSK